MRRYFRHYLLLFSSGDFAFNLYWQSLMMYMLFYQTEALRVPIELATQWYFIASIWDGIASMAVAVIVDRYLPSRSQRKVVLIGAVPLGLSFVCAYSPTPIASLAPSVWMLTSQLALRTAYAVVNVPYLAMSARISARSEDRALVAGLRMIFGALAAVVVVNGTAPLGQMLPHGDEAAVYRNAAILFAAVASLLLVVVAARYQDDDAVPSPAVGSIRDGLAAAWRNPAFVTLAAAMAAMIAASAMLDKSILYYFKYALGDQTSGQTTLALMAVISVIALPLWIAISRRFGVRAAWFMAVISGVLWLLGLGIADGRSRGLATLLLVLMQASIVGLNFAVWAMLPEAIAYGQRQTGVRVEAVLYGYVALIQRIAIGLGALMLGLTLSSGDHAIGPAHGSGAAQAFRSTMSAIPILLLLLSAAFMWLSPLKRAGAATGSHEAES
jgi:glucuronide carrier protein